MDSLDTESRVLCNADSEDFVILAALF